MLSVEENGAFLRINDATCIQRAGNIHSGTKWAASTAANASWQVQAVLVMVPPSRSHRPVWRQKTPGLLSGWPPPASVHQHGTLLLVYDQYEQGCIRSLGGMARYEGKYDTGHPCDTNPLCCCKGLCSIFATETFSSWPGDKQVCPVFCWHTHCFMSDVILSNSEVCVLMLNQWSVTHTLHRCCTCLLQRSVLPWHFISYPTVVNLKSALNCSIIFPFISVCADRIPVGCSFPVYRLL